LLDESESGKEEREREEKRRNDNIKKKAQKPTKVVRQHKIETKEALV
jgi:hypothetical protein